MPKSDYFKPMGRSDLAASSKKSSRGMTMAHANMVNREAKADQGAPAKSDKRKPKKPTGGY
jgi:hypothetical protein